MLPVGRPVALLPEEDGRNSCEWYSRGHKKDFCFCGSVHTVNWEERISVTRWQSSRHMEPSSADGTGIAATCV